MESLAENPTITNKRLVISLINSNSERIEFQSIGNNVKTESLKYYKRVVVDQQISQFVCCSLCRSVVVYKPIDGTTGVNRHLVSCQKNIPQRALTTDEMNDSVVNESNNDLNNDNSINDNNNKRLKTRNVLNNSQRIVDKNNETLNEDLRKEIFKLKAIVKKCLDLINCCKCFTKYIKSERKLINSLVFDYNNNYVKSREQKQKSKLLSRDQNNQLSEDNSNGSVDDNEESAHLGSYGEDNSDEDSITDPTFRPKLRKTNANQNIVTSNAIKRKYILIKKKPKVMSTDQKFVCEWPGCGVEFKQKKSIKKHCLRAHSTDEIFACYWPGCDETFNKKYNLESHMCSHTNEKRFKCQWPGCRYEANAKYRIFHHQKVHSTEKSLKCDWPGCEFATKYLNNIRNHKLRHTGEKPWKCSWPECEWRFRLSDTLKVHMLKHTGEKPFACDIAGCDQKFRSRQLMRFHCEKVHIN